MKQYKIGQKFKYNGWVYEVVENNENWCDFSKHGNCIKTYDIDCECKNFKLIKPTLSTRIKNTIKYIMHP